MSDFIGWLSYGSFFLVFASTFAIIVLGLNLQWGFTGLFNVGVAGFVALGAYSHAALKDVVRETGIEYQRLERGIAHFYSDEESFAEANGAARLMQLHGVQRRVVSTAELLKIEPAFQAFSNQIVGGTYTASDESGDARVFTEQLAARCGQQGAQFLYGHDIEQLHKAGGELESVRLRDRTTGQAVRLTGDAIVAACGSYTAPLLRTVGVDLPIYPGKGYSATFPILNADKAPTVSTIDDKMKIAMSRLGNCLRVAGTIELGGFDLSLDSPIARARCQALARRVEQVLPGVCDTRLESQGGQPNFWCGLRPATPTNIPFIGQTPVRKLWVNAGHGTLGWTHGAGSGKAIAELISGDKPQMAFTFRGQ